MTGSHSPSALLVAGSYGPRVHYAVNELARVDGILVVAGEELADCDLLAGTVPGSELIRYMLDPGEVEALGNPESFLIKHRGGTLIVAGGDEQGLMYGLLEVSEQFEFEYKEIDQIEEIRQSPQAPIRGIFTFLHNRDCEEEWFHSTDHWSDYFDLLARSRFNSFNLVLGHQTNYLAPPFPFFLEVPDHPWVTVPGVSPDQRRRNLESLRMVTELADRHGLEFVLGIWQVMAWNFDSRGGPSQESLVEGLNWDNLADYTYRATSRLLSEVPGIDGIQLRVNGESGVPTERQTRFFSETIFRAMRESEREVFLDLRGWMAEETTIEFARNLGIPMRLSMKYWAEHLGAPYQAADQKPAYSYADFLRYPRTHPAIYQVWALGSHRHFVWGDPEYVRTFASSLDLGESSGFEISPPLAQKGFGNEPGAWRIIETEHEHYRWEWERYWMFYLCFGRLTYDPHSGPAPWQRRLRARFGPAAVAVEELYAAASKILSFIVAFNLSDPNMYIWPEADTGGLLDFYMSVPPSDPARFEGILEAADRLLRGEPTPRISPERTAGILEEMGKTTLGAAQEVAAHGTSLSGDSGAELRATVVDATALGHLALYHSNKTRAALALALYYRSGDLSALIEARHHLTAARPHWQSLAGVTDGFYTDKQVTGPVDSGHWKDRLVLVDEDEARLEERIKLHRRFAAGTIAGAVAAYDMGGAPSPDYSYTRFPVHREMVERGFIGVDDGVRWGNPLTSSHGWEAVQGSMWAKAAPLARLSDRHLDSLYRDTMTDPGHDRLEPFVGTLFRDYVAGEGTARFNASVPAGTYEITIVSCDLSPNQQDHGPFSVSVNGEQVAEEIVVPAGETFEVSLIRVLGRGFLSVDFESDRGKDWFCSALIVRPARPVAAHRPPWTAESGSDVNLTLSVTSAIEVAGVDAEVGDTLEEMSSDEGGIYALTVPGESLREGSLTYRFRIEGEDGTVTWHPQPDANSMRPTFSLSIRPESGEVPRLSHTPIRLASPGKDIPVFATVENRGLCRAVLNYRYVNQYYAWNRLAMSIDGNALHSVISGSYVVPEWDLMYYIELIADDGTGTIAPGSDDLLHIPYWVIRVDR